MRAWDSDGAAPDPDNEGTRATDKANQRKPAVGSALEKADDVEAKSRGAKYEEGGIQLYADERGE